jgi:replicative superfamily II helicase
MDQLKIPQFLQVAYRNGRPAPAITTIRPWQAELLQSPQWTRRQNCLIILPSAAGKTLPVEVAIAQTLQRDSTAKILYCLPFVALADEKYSQFLQRFPQFGVRQFYANTGGYEFNNGSIAIATFEKAHSLINIAQRKGNLNRIALVIIDEIHMIGDDNRGANLEALIATLKLPGVKSPQIIALSATINQRDAQMIGNWLGAFVFQRDERPSQITHFVARPDSSLIELSDGRPFRTDSIVQTIPQDRTKILPLIARAFHKFRNTSIIIFVNRKLQARSIAEFIAKYLYSPEFGEKLGLSRPSADILRERFQLIATIKRTRAAPDEIMTQCLMKGIAFHHAGMILEERKLIEDSLRQGIINIVVATTTLSAGINILNVSTIIIENVYRITDDQRREPLSCAEYCQMAGRAGRISSQVGEVIIIQHSTNRDENELISVLSTTNANPIFGRLFHPPDLDKYWLQCIYFFGSFMGRSFINASFVSSANQDQYQNLLDRLSESNASLIANGLIDSNLRMFRLGMAIAAANFGIEEGLSVFDKLRRANKDYRSTDLYLLYLCMPIIFRFTTPPYRDEIWNSLHSTHIQVFDLTVGISERDFQGLITISYRNCGNKTKTNWDFLLDQFYGACVMLAVIEEQSISQIERHFGIDRGTIESLQTATATFASQICQFCNVYGLVEMNATIRKFKPRLDYAVKSELLPLMALPSCNPALGRVLFNSGISRVDDLAEWSIDQIIELVGGTCDREWAKELKIEAEQASAFAQISQSLDDVRPFAAFPAHV